MKFTNILAVISILFIVLVVSNTVYQRFFCKIPICLVRPFQYINCESPDKMEDSMGKLRKLALEFPCK